MNEQAIRSAIAAIQEMHKQYDALNQVLSLDHSGPFTDAIWQLENRLVEALDVDGWLEWFVSTNSFGDNGMLAGYPPNCREIHTVEDLIELIKEAERRDRIIDENNQGSEKDNYGNTLSWKATPDYGLIEISLNGEELVSWCYEDDAESVFNEFLTVWTRAQDATGNAD